MSQKEEREATKARHEAYRSAARKHGTVRDQVQVCEDAEHDGAFVEVIVWISKDELTSPSLEPDA